METTQKQKKTQNTKKKKLIIKSSSSSTSSISKKKPRKKTQKKRKLIIASSTTSEINPLVNKNENKTDLNTKEQLHKMPERLNEQFIDLMEQLSNIMLKQGEPFRARAYQKAQETIMAYPNDILSMYSTSVFDFDLSKDLIFSNELIA